MDKSVTCEHLNKLVEHFDKELWQSKENLACFDCGCPGPNLWICLQPECLHIGCSEVKNDHSTIHQKNYPLHSVHMNVSTDRIWCYLCEKEVHKRAALRHAQLNPEPSAEDASVTARLSSMGVANSDDEADPDDMDLDFDDEPPRGLVGLQNIGNTCYMNAALQALSNTQPLTSYFLDCAAAVAVLSGDKKPGLSRAYQKLMQEMWHIRSRGYVVPNGILYGIRNVHPMFRGYQQHDTQEFLRCFLDQLHEELKEPVWDASPEDKLTTEADGDHQEANNILVRRRAASSGASDAPFFARMRRPSPAPSSYNEPRDGYLRMEAARHRRSASFAGTSHATYHLPATAANGTAGSESELSSSEPDERYETASSNSDCASPTPDPPKSTPYGGSGGGGDGGAPRYRSVVSDVFDGKLLSSVQCLICDRVSTRVETFQDLSLPIPSREHLAVLRCQQPILNHAPMPSQDSWLWWVVSWLRSWFYGPVVSLQDCLAAFFSADELKGDNMYSCSRCNKLRNGVKLAGVLRLPEVLCVHLKRFRHELMFSAKVAARVSFPISDLNMAPYLHKDCTSKISRYSLCAVICHAGTAGGGHYTCVARGGASAARGGTGGGADDWYLFDDASVTPLPAHQLPACEAYVLFYRKVNPQMTVLRQKAAEILKSTSSEPNDIKFYISKQWLNKFNTWAEPGPIDNSDFVCGHGGVRPERAPHLPRLAARLPQPLWEFLHHHFGGGPAVSHAHECGSCARAAARLRARRERELAAFVDLHRRFQEQERPSAIYAISMQWFRLWQAFVRDRARQPPPPVDNTNICNKQEVDGVVTYAVKAGSDHAQLSEELWRFFTGVYGGGPELRLRAPAPPPAPAPAPPPPPAPRPHYDSDREDYRTKSISETNLRDSVHGEMRNHSLQNVRRYKKKSAESDENISYRHFQYEKHEPNGNYHSDDEPAGRLDNGVDGSDPDEDVPGRRDPAPPPAPPADAASHKTKPKPGKVRKAKRRTVK
ncbi:ubiquitin carboxyl-terminal hydrolase 20 isoform X2 [Aricia agestis]|uniref:ubiquitin carboxyl-terminal hydrolase 20 isoform X2 n=1 Tax=Aricia agestis TaxID=91739 RepID=UPI001C202D57|nr:ubiquitin carboxyl-terminal hydrolase 20 isoform X2 [Aricia agestis]